MAVTINYKGTAEECLHHFLHEYSWPEVQAFTAEFSGVSEASVRRWYNGGATPIGMIRIRTRIMLHLLGYQVSEYDSMPAFNKKLAQLLAFEVVSVEAIMEITGHNNDEAVMRLVRDGSRMETERQFRVEQELKDEKYTDPLEIKHGVAEMRVDKLLRNLEPEAGRVSDDGDQPAPVEPVVPPAATVSPTPAADKPAVAVTSGEDDMAYALVDMLKAVVTLGQVVEGTPSWQTQRHYVRLMVEQHGTADAVVQFLDRLRSS